MQRVVKTGLWSAVAVVLCSTNALAQSQTTEKLFAAPAAANSAATSSAGSLGQVTLALAVVLALVFVAAWALKKLRTVQRGTTGGIEVISQVALGNKERAVLLKVMGQHVLVGVTPNQVNALHVLPAGSEVAEISASPALGSTSPTLQTFQSILKQSLGIKRPEDK